MAENSPEMISPSEAAERHGIARQFVHQLIADGRIDPERHGRGSLLRADRIAELLHLSPGRGRPKSQESAWKYIRSADHSWLGDPETADQQRRRLHPRARFVRGYAHKSVVPKLSESRLLVRSGYAAGEHHGIAVNASDAVQLAYVSDADFGSLPAVRWRHLASPRNWNVQIGIVERDVWPFGRSEEFVDPVTLWLDLEDQRDRAAQLVREHLPFLLDARG